MGNEVTNYLSMLDLSRAAIRELPTSVLPKLLAEVEGAETREKQWIENRKLTYFCQGNSYATFYDVTFECKPFEQKCFLKQL